ncbi:hypothetical protein [Reinekea sp.]|uniref:hypothetical protein n=1 Tax=Reinekea sp. TaxID=1970455 RepID=UPI002A7F1062|nr:hypothetical protein [Reinekea sp.]
MRQYHHPKHQTNNSDRQSSYQALVRSSALGNLVRAIVITMVLIAAAIGGLWLIGTSIGLVFGLLALAIGLAPILFVAWLVWLVVRAVVY